MLSYEAWSEELGMPGQEKRFREMMADGCILKGWYVKEGFGSFFLSPEGRINSKRFKLQVNKCL